MSPDQLPIACSLDGGALQERLAKIRALGARSLLTAGADGRVHTLRFRRDEETRRDLEQIVAAETRCCPFLRFDLKESGAELILTITALEGGEDTAAALATAFAAT